MCRYISNPTFEVDFQNLGIQYNYPNSLRINLYRIIQELITNSIKHSEATKILVQCSEMDEWLFVTVVDNGKGIIENNENNQKGVGWANIQNRSSFLNASIETISHPREG